jgi:hypothetical protein
MENGSRPGRFEAMLYLIVPEPRIEWKQDASNGKGPQSRNYEIQAVGQ